MNPPPWLAVLVIVLAVAIGQNTIKCKYDGPYPGDPCKHISILYLQDIIWRTEIYLDTLVLIATKNNDNSYTIKGFGAAVAEDYFLTAVSATFPHYGNDDLYIILNQDIKYEVYTLKAQGVYPETFIGHYNLSAWQDLALVKLHPAFNFKFPKFMKISGNNTLTIPVPDLHDDLRHDDLRPELEYLNTITLKFFNEEYQILQPSLQPLPDCIKMFDEDELQFDPVYMGCSSDNEKYIDIDEDTKDMDFLHGAPIAYLPDDGDPVLFGIHSLGSLTDPDKFLITYTAPHCKWLSSVSNGAVNCVDVVPISPAQPTTKPTTSVPEVATASTTKPPTTTLPPTTTTTLLTTPEPPKTPENTICDEGWEKGAYCGTVNCYHSIDLNGLVNFKYVENDICAKENPGSHLVSIHCEDEMDYVKNNTQRVLTGYHLPKSLQAVWDPNNFQWNDGSPVDYKPRWSVGMPRTPDGIIYDDENVASTEYFGAAGAGHDMINIKSGGYALCKKPADVKS